MTNRTPEATASRKAALLFASGLLGAVLLGILLVSNLLRPPEPPTPPEQRSTTTYMGSAFGDLDHGYVIAERCTSNFDCTQNLFVTEDGKHWARRASPAPHELLDRVVPLGGCRLVVEYVTDPKRPASWYSADCARSWRQVPVRARTTTARIPPQSALDIACYLPGALTIGCEGQLIVTVPSTGRRMRLDANPDLTPMSAMALPNGTWAASGPDPATGDLAIAVSADDGRSWRTGLLPGVRQVRAGSVRITAHGEHMYAWADDRRTTNSRLAAMWHSGDGGSTWERTWRPRTADRAIDGSAQEGSVTLVPRHGDLLVVNNVLNGQPIHLISTDHGRTLAPIQLPTPLRSVRFVPDGLIGIAEDPSGSLSKQTSWSFYRSRDAVQWKEIAAPPYTR